MGLRQVFGSNLERLRRERGLSQEDLAHAAGLERSYVGKLENARYSASLDTIEKLSQALGVPARAFFDAREES